jgi:RNA polymerase sigma factor (sigma-70 family)
MRMRSSNGSGDRLSPERERELVCAAANGDQAMRDRLVTTFTPLIASVARTYRGSAAMERTDLMQEGVAGLLTALRRFDPELGTPFWAYASWWVRQAMQQFVAETTRSVVLSDRAFRRLARVKDARRALGQAGNGEPTTADLVDATGFTREQIESLQTAERTARGLEEPVRGENGPATTVGELIEDPFAGDDYERVLDGCDVGRVRKLVRELPDRERGILHAHHGLDGRPKTLREIAEVLGLSVERVRQIEERALTKLRESFEVPPARPAA